jgi:mRNA interferase MazF
MAGRGAVVPRRGEVYLVNFDPTVGAEIKKTRPALIIQNDVANEHSPVTIVAAITSAVAGKSYPTEISLELGDGGLDRSSIVLLNQLRTIDRSRLVKKLGAVGAGVLARVDLALRTSLGLTRETR